MQFQVGRNRCVISFEVIELGKDMIIIITGGDAHIGAVTLCITRKGLNDLQRFSDLCSLLSIPGHKEKEIAIELSKEITSGTGKTCVVIIGIHLDNITPYEIKTIKGNCRVGAKKIVEELRT